MKQVNVADMRNIEGGKVLTGTAALNACKGLYNSKYNYYAYCKKCKAGVATSSWCTYQGFRNWHYFH